MQHSSADRCNARCPAAAVAVLQIGSAAVQNQKQRRRTLPESRTAAAPSSRPLKWSTASTPAVCRFPRTAARRSQAGAGQCVHPLHPPDGTLHCHRTHTKHTRQSRFVCETLALIKGQTVSAGDAHTHLQAVHRGQPSAAAFCAPTAAARSLQHHRSIERPTPHTKSRHPAPASRCSAVWRQHTEFVLRKAEEAGTR